jgi:Mrp family chromosome partitioning ATPase/capsular polysaccharide biosynthesis protein
MDEALDLRALLRPLVDRIWLILAVVVLATAATYAYYASRPKEYNATTTLLIQPSPLERSLLGEQQGSLTDPEAAVLVIESGPTQRLVAERVGGDTPIGSVNATAPEQVNLSAANPLTITVTSSSAEGAARLANAYAAVLSSLSERRARQRVRETRRSAQARLDELKRENRDPLERRNLAREVLRLSQLESLPAVSAEQIDPATPPAEPFAPRPVRSALFAFAISLVLAIGGAYLLERLDTRVRRLEELRGLYGLPLLGAIPDEDAPPASVSEAFDTVRVNLELAAEPASLRTILVTSGLPGEGRSAIVRGLALSYRNAGKRVAVVEADLRDPRLADLFLLEASPGLREVLRGDRSLGDALQSVPAGEQTLVAAHDGGNGSLAQAGGSLAVLTAGSEGETETISPQRMRPLLQEVASDFDVVLVDSPPMLPLSDSVRLLSTVDGVIVVARLGHVSRDAATAVAENLSRLEDVRALGVVATGLSRPRFSGPRVKRAAAPS